MSKEQMEEFERMALLNQSQFGADPAWVQAYHSCPDCGHKQLCPCESCDNPIDLKPWVWQADGNSMACGNCGLVKSADDWAELEYKQYQQLKGNTNE